MIAKWTGIAFIVLGTGAYRMYYGEINIIEAAIVGGLSGGIGGALGALYERFFGKHEASIINFADNVLWFVLFAIPSSILGAIIAYGLLPYVAHELLQHIMMFVITLGATIYLTYRKIINKRKNKIKLLNEYDVK